MVQNRLFFLQPTDSGQWYYWYEGYTRVWSGEEKSQQMVPTSRNHFTNEVENMTKRHFLTQRAYTLNLKRRLQVNTRNRWKEHKIIVRLLSLITAHQLPHHCHVFRRHHGIGGFKDKCKGGKCCGVLQGALDMCRWWNGRLCKSVFPKIGQWWRLASLAEWRCKSTSLYCMRDDR